MAEDFYGGDQGEDVAQPEGDVEVEQTEKPAKESEEGETALVNNSFFPSECKVGDTYTVKVVAQHDGEKEIAFEKADKEKVEVEEETIDDRIDEAAMSNA